MGSKQIIKNSVDHTCLLWTDPETNADKIVIYGGQQHQ